MGLLLGDAALGWWETVPVPPSLWCGDSPEGAGSSPSCPLSTPQVSLLHYVSPLAFTTATLPTLIASIVCSTPGNLGLEHMLTNGRSFIGSQAPLPLCQIRCSRFLGSSLGIDPGVALMAGEGGGDPGGLQGPDEGPPWVLLLPLLARGPPETL